MCKLKKMAATVFVLTMLFSFSESVGTNYYKVLNSCYNQGKIAASKVIINVPKIDWSTVKIK